MGEQRYCNVIASTKLSWKDTDTTDMDGLPHKSANANLSETPSRTWLTDKISTISIQLSAFAFDISGATNTSRAKIPITYLNRYKSAVLGHPNTDKTVRCAQRNGSCVCRAATSASNISVGPVCSKYRNTSGTIVNQIKGQRQRQGQVKYFFFRVDC